jgi:hypothetical protein
MSVGFLVGFAGSVGPDGRAHVVWTIRDGERHVWARRFDPATGWPAEEPIDRVDQPVRSCPAFGGGQHGFLEPQIGVDPGGDAVAAWAETQCGDMTLWANQYLATAR